MQHTPPVYFSAWSDQWTLLTAVRMYKQPDSYKIGERWAKAKFCPYCGAALPELRKKAEPPEPLHHSADGHYCSTCNQRNHACKCLPPEAAWEIVEAPIASVRAFPLRNDDDWDRALEIVDRLWGAPMGTPEADVLDVFLALVDSYQRKHHPTPASTKIRLPSGKVVRIKPLTQSDLDRRTEPS
jgi:HTH-type transcriptional regulator/antitoxin HigA